MMVVSRSCSFSWSITILSPDSPKIKLGSKQRGPRDPNYIGPLARSRLYPQGWGRKKGGRDGWGPNPIIFSDKSGNSKKTKPEAGYLQGTSDDGQQLYSEVPLSWRLLGQEQQDKAFEHQSSADDIGETKIADQTLHKGLETTWF